MDDPFWAQSAAVLAALAFGASLLLLIFGGEGPGSRLVEAGTLFGLLLLSVSVFLRSVNDPGPS
jgi:hypothetical protein